MKNIKKIILVLVIMLLIVSIGINIMLYLTNNDTTIVTENCDSEVNLEEESVYSNSIVLSELTGITYLDDNGNEVVATVDTIYFDYDTNYARLLNEKYGEMIESYLDSNKTTEDGELDHYTIVNIDYTEYEGIGSVLFYIEGGNKEVSWSITYTENIDLETGMKISNMELFDLFNLEDTTDDGEDDLWITIRDNLASLTYDGNFDYDNMEISETKEGYKLFVNSDYSLELHQTYGQSDIYFEF